MSSTIIVKYPAFPDLCKKNNVGKPTRMKTIRPRTQAQGARRVVPQEDVVYEKMLMDADILNYTHVADGITISVTQSGIMNTPYTVDITCGALTFTQSIATYHEFQSLVNMGLGYFLGVFDDMNGTLPEDMLSKED